MFVTYISKYIKYIFAKSCIIKIYIFKVRYICQNIFDIYSNAVEIYFALNSCIYRVYISFIGLAMKSFRFFPFENHEKQRNDFVANPIHRGKLLTVKQSSSPYGVKFIFKVSLKLHGNNGQID